MTEAPSKQRKRKRDESDNKKAAAAALSGSRRMPVDMLETAWSISRNHPINPAYVQELLHAFRSGGLKRRAPENRIAVLCSAEEVRRIKQDGGDVEEADNSNDDNKDDDSPRKLSFLR
ncbi:hypothetical protein CGCA056_v002019 [Colletotrichum aenigma]|uniref:uncharacterized protein n=1 Tax=Colletotrichum aenigma TaxID=1215731 RepID=UPI0018725910|nr:uncharacterized protein CGCA056_v002019 [Colletotrichum aenigma]KAF5528035.1 hypothetical protein CGCA056_v002019 [Colletotrichum aenigma]